MIGKGLLIISVTFGLFAGVAGAMPTSTVQIQCEGGELEKTYGPGEIVCNPKNFYIEDQQNNEDVGDVEWKITFDTDPYVISWISLKNTTSSAKTYTVTFSVDIYPEIMPTCLYGGSVSGLLSTDPAGGFVSTVASAPLYLGMIDGNSVLSLYPNLSSWSSPSGGITIIEEQSAGLPGPTLPYGSATSTISIQHKFRLGAGDTVTLDGYFEVVPEPATICLLGLGVLSLIRRKR